jgi:ribonuclease D
MFHAPIATDYELEQLADLVSAASLVAVDTEFIRERTYFPELCLLQISTDAVTACIDCRASLDLQPLLRVLVQPGRTWVLHSARQDIEVLRTLGDEVSPPSLIDTQIAGSLLGLPPQIGLQALLNDMLAVTLAKEFTRTDWRRRPLPEPAVRYALDDVRYLLSVWARQRAQLDALGRLPWLDEDCARLVTDSTSANVETIFRRLKAVATLGVEEQCAALALVEWRERRAMQSDRPRRWILADDVLIQIARRLPRSPAELRSISELPPGVAAKSGKGIVEAVEQSGDSARRRLVAALAAEPRPDKTRTREVRDIVAEHAGKLGIEPEVLATRRDILALAANVDPHVVVPGWRAGQIGPLLSREN